MRTQAESCTTDQNELGTSPLLFEAFLRLRPAVMLTAATEQAFSRA